MADQDLDLFDFFFLIKRKVPYKMNLNYLKIEEDFTYFLTEWGTLNLLTAYGQKFFLSSGFGPDPEPQKW